jgi:hypothetical protein
MRSFGGFALRWPLRLVLLLAFSSIGTLSATVILSCNLNGSALPSGSCYSLQNFSFNETLDWQSAYGTADDTSPNNPNYNPVTSGGPWLAALTPSGLQVGSTFGPTYGGTNLISRIDNFGLVFNGTDWVFPFDPSVPAYNNWQNFNGTFDAPVDPNNPNTGPTGDHLLSTSGGTGALELQFSRGISGALFRISNGTSGDVDATIAAYGVLNPSATDIPLMTYTIHATLSGDGSTPGGVCASLYNDPPTPCNTAPYIGITGGGLSNIRSVVISTPTASGVYIDTLYLSDAEVPEPSTFVLTGVVGILAILARRRMLCDRQP